MFDCIVLGTGGIGSAALHCATKKGWKVLGIDQFGPAHNLGSSHGQTRMIRTAYFEHPNYVPLVQRALKNWDEIQCMTPLPLLRRSGLLQIGYEDGAVVQGVLKSAADHSLELERLTAKQVRERYPLIKPNDEHVAIFEQEAGFLRVEKCIATLLKRAMVAGAQYASSTKVIRWEAEIDGTYTVITDKENYRTKRLIVTAGAWSQSLLESLGLPLRIVRKQQQWIQSDRVDGHVETGFPCFIVETSSRDWFYGIPAIDKLGMKIAEHTGGQPIDSPDGLDRELSEHEVERVKHFVDQHLDFGHYRVIYHDACMYTFSPDEHFIVDRHPEHEGVVFAAGMSGHGFKFAPVLGDQLVELLVSEGDSKMEFLKLSRFGDALSRGMNTNE